MTKEQRQEAVLNQTEGYNRTNDGDGLISTNIQKAKMLTSGDELTRVNTELHKLAMEYV